MNFTLEKSHRMIQTAVREFALKEVEPMAAKIDESREYPSKLIPLLAEQGFLGVVIPEKYGGSEMDFTSLAILVEETSRVCSSTGVILAVQNSLVAWPIYKWGTEEQRTKYLPDLCSGKKIGSFALTEPDAGSDAGSLKTVAKLDGDNYILNGSKMFITNAEVAKVFLVAAKTDPEAGVKGITVFIVDRDTPGFEVGKHENLLGVRATGNCQLSFDGVKVPKANVLGKVNGGFGILMTILDTSRIDIGAQGLGIAQGALDAAVKYSKQRVQFGKPICEFEMIQQMLADMGTTVEAARLLIYRAAYLKDSGAERFTREAAMAKLFGTEAATDVSRLAIQIFGGYGCSKDYPVERFYRDAKITEIYEGTNQIQRIVISRELTR